LTEGKPLRHRYPIWIAWPQEIAAFVIVFATTWNVFQTGLRVFFKWWPDALDPISAVPYVKVVKAIVAFIVGDLSKGPSVWEEITATLPRVFVWAAVLYFVAALVRNFLPALRLHEKGLQVRRGLGWVTIPWKRLTQVQNMTLADDRLVLLIQGRRWRLGPWFRFYSLLWGAGLKKGVLVSWHLSDFDIFAGELVGKLHDLYGDEEIDLVVDDMAYSLLYALLFQPRATWSRLFAPKQVTAADAFSHARWLRSVMSIVVALLLILGFWRYIGVWWQFLAGSFPKLQSVLRWPVLGDLLKLFGLPNMSLFQSHQPLLASPGIGLLMGQVSIILVLVAVSFLQGLFPDWILGAEGPSASFRKRWLPVRWGAIRAIRETVVRQGKGIILVQVKWPGLTFWHTLYSLFYGAGLRRGVLFSSLLPGFEDLRQRIHLGVIRAHEKEAKPPEKPILVEDGESDFLSMVQAPAATMRRWGKKPPIPEREEPEEGGGGLLKRPGLSSSNEDMPWEGRRNWPLFELEQPEEEAKVPLRTELWRTIRAALGIALWPLLLIILGEVLYPPLSQPLALFALSPRVAGGLGPLVAISAVMIVLWLGEAPFIALLTSLIAEMYDQKVSFRQTLLLHPRIHSVRAVLGVGVLILGATGMVQPMYLLWSLGSLVWGTFLVWLAGRELHGWKDWGSLMVPAGYVLYQALTLLVYFLIR
jgi:hypothetical protein